MGSKLAVQVGGPECRLQASAVKSQETVVSIQSSSTGAMETGIPGDLLASQHGRNDEFQDQWQTMFKKYMGHGRGRYQPPVLHIHGSEYTSTHTCTHHIYAYTTHMCMNIHPYAHSHTHILVYST